MIDFKTYPSYNPYRVMTYRPDRPFMNGADVYGLQRTINAIIRSELVCDGILGPKTGGKIADLQTALSVTNDGLCGGGTQTAGTLAFLHGQSDGDLFKVERGHVEHESSNLWGNYSPKRTDASAPQGWSYDAGVAQMNSAHNDVKIAFEPQVAIGLICQKTKDAYIRYSDTSKFVGDDHSDRRRWKLATGHWNAPAYAQWLAGFRDSSSAAPPPAARSLLEAYMEDAVVYLP